MLVLTRKQNQKICIGDKITVTVLRMKGKSVRLGIEAPTEIDVLRGELAAGPADTQIDVADNVAENNQVPVAKRSLQPSSQALHRTDHWPAQKPSPLHTMGKAKAFSQSEPNHLKH